MAKKRYTYLTETERKILRMKRAILILAIACLVLAGALAFILSTYVLVPRIIVP